MTRRRVLDDDQAADVVAGYKAGSTIIELADAFGVSQSPIRRVIIEAGVPLRRRSWREKPVDVPEILRRYRHGDSMSQISRDLGLPDQTIRRRLLAAGVQPKPRQRRHRPALAPSVDARCPTR